MRGIFGFQPGIFRVTQFMNYESIWLSNLDRIFQKTVLRQLSKLGLFYNQNSFSYEGFDLKKWLKMQEFGVNYF